MKDSRANWPQLHRLLARCREDVIAGERDIVAHEERRATYNAVAVNGGGDGTLPVLFGHGDQVKSQLSDTLGFASAEPRATITLPSPVTLTRAGSARPAGPWSSPLAVVAYGGAASGL